MTALFVLYVVIGAVVYFVTDTTALARQIKSSMPFVTYGMALQLVFAGVVTLWPLWLVWRRTRANDSSDT
ncbi:hypothetical protein [Viridibacterium curvum]|uniref:Uncharacterized protein n=1 Tax=Viridibacterium curvum TaxID=1101404 RepID=A0ABP9QM64_9RHOO